MSYVSRRVTGQLLRTTRPTTVGEGGRKCPLAVRLLMLGRRGNKLSQANQVAWPWRPEVGRRGNVYHTKLRETSPLPLNLRSSSAYTHNTAILQDRFLDLTLHSPLQLFSSVHHSPQLTFSVITTNIQDGCHQAGACHQHKLQQHPPSMPHLHDETQRFPLIHRKVHDSKSSNYSLYLITMLLPASITPHPHRFFQPG